MITVTTNIGEVAARLSNRIATIERTQDKMIRTICTTLVPIIKERIHERGEYSDGTSFFVSFFPIVSLTNFQVCRSITTK